MASRKSVGLVVQSLVATLYFFLALLRASPAAEMSSIACLQWQHSYARQVASHYQPNFDLPEWAILLQDCSQTKTLSLDAKTIAVADQTGGSSLTFDIRQLDQ